MAGRHRGVRKRRTPPGCAPRDQLTLYCLPIASASVCTVVLKAGERKPPFFEPRQSALEQAVLHGRRFGVQTPVRGSDGALERRPVGHQPRGVIKQNLGRDKGHALVEKVLVLQIEPVLAVIAQQFEQGILAFQRGKELASGGLAATGSQER